MSVDPRLELTDVITEAITNSPRSLQTAIGPSEVGVECDRRIGYKLADVEPVNHRGGDGWLPTIGTATHSWLADVFAGKNAKLGYDRYLVESRVSIPLPSGGELSGSCDLYDTLSDEVIDWKIVGKTTLDKAKRGNVSEQYKTQIQLYGLGFWYQGRDVEQVTIAYLPRNGPLRDGIYVSAPFDAEAAADAVARLESIRTATQLLGPSGVAALRTADSYCSGCPWFSYASKDAATACPGDAKYRSSFDLSDLVVG